MDKFITSMKFVGQWEWGNKNDGGYTNNPVDPGGETRYGISKRQYPILDIKTLKLADALTIYERDYWKPCGGPTLAWPLALAVFDSAINLGLDDALPWLKRTQDFKEYLDLRVAKYYRIVERKPALKMFLKGWLNRVNDLKKFADVHPEV